MEKSLATPTVTALTARVTSLRLRHAGHCIAHGHAGGEPDSDWDSAVWHLMALAGDNLTGLCPCSGMVPSPAVWLMSLTNVYMLASVFSTMQGKTKVSH